jgi:polyisoprenoid-binding protein YceI
MKNGILAITTSALLVVGGSAQAATYALDTTHTQIGFSVNHQGFSNSRGMFTDFEGTVDFDEADVGASIVDVTIQTGSLNMNDDTWNEHLSGEKWFNVSAHPTMTFKSTGVTSTGENTMDVVGDLTLLGVTKPATLHVILNKVGEVRGGNIKAGFSATANIDRTEWGLSTFAPVIGSEISIRIEVEAIQQ